MIRQLFCYILLLFCSATVLPSSCFWHGKKSFDALFHNYTNLNGTTKYAINNENDYYNLLQNGSLKSTSDFPVLWTYSKFTSGKRFYQGVMSMGQSNEYRRLQTKLSTNAAVNIVAVGGSVTCGQTRGKWYPDSPGLNLNNTWAKYLETYLRQYHDHACHSSSSYHQSSRIKVHNLCLEGAGSNVWVDKVLEWRQKKTHIINIADLVIVEAALNDVTSILGVQNYSRFGSSRDIKNGGMMLGMLTHLIIVHLRIQHII